MEFYRSNMMNIATDDEELIVRVPLNAIYVYPFPKGTVHVRAVALINDHICWEWI